MAMEQAIVSNWVEKPSFVVTEKEANFIVEYEIVPKAGEKHWRWVSRGVKARDIVPVNKPMLRFPYAGKGMSYMPKTMRGFYGGPGVKVGPIQSFKKVHWPGIEPRFFEEDCMSVYKPTFDAAMSAALGMAMQNIKGGKP
jgi:hypothetical protein